MNFPNHTEGLRQRKRRETRQRIFDTASSLVAREGYDNVTVEDICQGAGISRRTFFNYMDSKDEAILGPSPLEFTSESFTRIANEQSTNMLALIIDAMEESDATAGVEDACRLQRLVQDNPSLANAMLARKRDTLHHLELAVREHLKRHAEDRRLDASEDAEARIIVELFRTTFVLFARSPHFQEEEPPKAQARRIAAVVTKYVKELQW
ncbi:TetR/AcrR family transcriptional regulator [Corynebacterium sp. NML130628]|uniref:TetR/AcrR family transcriptional regulator n=1 Tax=Corynebacterium sp. NML130628 TaxID=1906333 RepID=UPI0008FB4598|nr:TetR/AcrR family transcriptional regulator [Corynebacterium sp. NML130628]